MKKILLIGGGGHCKSIIDTLTKSECKYDTISIIDIPEKCGSTICGIEIIGTDRDLTNLFKKGYREAFVTVGSVGNPIRRIELYKSLKEIGFIMPLIRDSSASVSESVKIGEGVFIGKNVVVNADSEIQKGAIINSSATVEHDCKIGEFVHVAPGSVICGNTYIGDSVHIGANATIIQGLHVGKHSIIGAGSVVIKNVEDNAVIVGNPARRIK